ncbi:unnamed protein product, partial [Rotaria sp. Silwood1]
VKSSIYRGTWHALCTTVLYEGFRSLYKGFLVYNCQLLPGLIYITTFEATRARANILTKNEYLRAGVGGTIDSLSSKSDSILSNKSSSSDSLHHRHIPRIHVPKEIRTSNYLIFKHICTALLYEKYTDKDKKSGISFKGFYRGYLISTFLFSLTSAIWWPSYYYYQRQMFRIEAIFSKEFSLPLIVIQCIAGPLSSLTSTMLTNPLDVCRTRIQVEQQRRRMTQIMYELWQEERFHVFTKGLTARLSHSCIYSLLIIFGYETVKRVSLK